jgi:hypothetical protein
MEIKLMRTARGCVTIGYSLPIPVLSGSMVILSPQLLVVSSLAKKSHTEEHNRRTRGTRTIYGERCYVARALTRQSLT